MASLRLLRRAAPILAVAGATAAGTAALAAAGVDPCGGQRAGASCSFHGGGSEGIRTPGGNGKVSHKGWPLINGMLWQADNRGRTVNGSEFNDELLGGHGNDRIEGGAGADVLWGDKNPTDNTPRQHDVMSAGDGKDWIYTSHGSNRVRAGAGRDVVFAYYGHGTIDCGPGRDTARIRLNGAYRLHGCEVIRNFCAFGSIKGRCAKPGEKRAVRRSGT